MLTLLAQSTPSAGALSSFLEVAFYLVGFFTAVVVLVKQFTGKSEEVRVTPSPLEVKEHPTMANRTEIDQLHGRIKREREEIEGKLTRLEAEDKELRRKLDEEISALNDRIDAVPERTINLLRSTKGLIQ